MPRQAAPRRRKDSKYWWISVPDPKTGKSTRVSAGTTNFKEAVAIQAKARRDHFEAEKFGRTPDRYLEDCILKFIEETRDEMAESTLERIGWAGKRIQEEWAGRTVQSLTKEDIANYKQRRRKGLNGRPAGPGTIAKELNLASSAIKHCNHNYDWNLPNVFVGRIPRPNNARERWLTPDEEAPALIKAAGDCVRAPYMIDLVITGLNTGMRPGELLGLEIARVDFKNSCAYMRKNDSKNRAPAIVPLNNEAKAAIRRRLAWQKERGIRSLHVFCGYKGERLMSVRTAWKGILKRAGITDLKPHDMRHTAASWLAQQGYSLVKIGKLLRHKDIRSTARYAHLNNESARELSESLCTFTARSKKNASEEEA